jgi:serine/threonine protein kinase
MSEVSEQFGPYTRIRRLGAGGMAETFLAVQRGTGGFEQRVCMKFILPAYRQDEDFRRLFLREASIAASLRHSNIVGVIDVDAAAGYLVLELVDGLDLRALLNAAPGHRLAPDLATFITLELCKALSYAHGRKRKGMPDGVVHRDLSASNVLISYAGEVKLTDFGVARAMRADIEPLSGTIKGKLCYMSPEQARGMVVDGRSDLFSLGVLCYELLAGKRPFDGPTDAETLLRITAGQYRPLTELAPEVPLGLSAVVERLLARDRDQRFLSADACIDALARFAPKATTFRELGDLSRATRPHQTLPSHEVLALQQTAASTPPERPFAFETQLLLVDPGPAPRARAPRTTPEFARSAPDGAPSATSVARRTPGRVNSNAWRVLGVALLLLLAVGAAWAARIANGPENSVGPTAVTSPPATPTTPATMVIPTVANPPSPRVVARAAEPPISPPSVAQNTQGASVGSPAAATDPGPGPTNEWEPGQPSAAADPASEPPFYGPHSGHKRRREGSGRWTRHIRSDAAARSTQPAPVEDEPATDAPSDTIGEALLHIGVVPVGQVWIDKRLVGWTPIDAKLSAGTHTIAAGATHPEVHQTVRLKPGEARQLVLNLEGIAPTAATPELADR